MYALNKKIITPLLSILLFSSLVNAKLPKLKGGDPLPSNLFIEMAKLANPAVVNISTTQLPAPSQQLDPNNPNAQLFRHFFGGRFRNPQPRHSLGTGFIIREDGLMITNNHVIDAADVIKVQLNEGGEEYEAQVIGKDKRTDIALIKINVKKKLPILKLGNSSTLEVGEWVAAFGNPYGHGHTMTKGIVSAKGRAIKELNKFAFIQTDASINPGNSGGPLINTRGEVVGVNTAIDGRAQGIGFAIPIDEVKSIITQLEKDGHIKRGFLGVQLGNLTPRVVQMLKLKDNKGAFIMDVVPGSSADKAKVKPYDIVVNINGKKIDSPQALFDSVQDLQVGKTVEMKVVRKGKKKDLKITIMQHPEDKNKHARKKKSKKTYRGQKAPFNLGFNVSNFTRSLAKNFNIPPLRKSYPIVIQVKPRSKASESGLSEGDVILDVNQKTTTKASDVIRYLKNGQSNLLRVLKGDKVVLIELTP